MDKQICIDESRRERETGRDGQADKETDRKIWTDREGEREGGARGIKRGR